MSHCAATYVDIVTTAAAAKGRVNLLMASVASDAMKSAAEHKIPRFNKPTRGARRVFNRSVSFEPVGCLD